MDINEYNSLFLDNKISEISNSLHNLKVCFLKYFPNSNMEKIIFSGSPLIEKNGYTLDYCADCYGSTVFEYVNNKKEDENVWEK